MIYNTVDYTFHALFRHHTHFQVPSFLHQDPKGSFLHPPPPCKLSSIDKNLQFLSFDHLLSPYYVSLYSMYERNLFLIVELVTLYMHIYVCINKALNATICK